MPKFSCTVIAKDEADRIGRCLAALAGLTDDIVVVDSGSTDGTVTIAERAGARVIHRDWDGYGPQKRFAEECAKYDWVLNLDADEVLTAELALKIKALMSAEPDLPAYRFRQVTVYPGQEKPRTWADYHHYVRLYDRRVVRFHTSLTHDTVDMRGLAAGTIDGDALHFSFRSLEHIRRKLDGYTDLQAKEMTNRRLWLLHVRRPLDYPFLFLRYYFLRRHFTGGLYGVKVAHIFAAGRARRSTKILAAHRAAKRTKQA